MYLPEVSLADDYNKLEAELPSAEGLKKIKILDSLSNYFIDNNPRRSLDFSFQLLKYAENLHNDTFATKALYSLAVAYKSISNYDSSLHFVKKTLIKISNQKNPNLVGFCRILLGDISIFHGDIQEALSNYKEALKCFQETKDIKNQVICHLNISSLYSTLKPQEIENEHFSQAEKLLKSSLANTEEINYLQFLSNLYLNLKRYDKSNEYLAKIAKSPEFKSNKSFLIDYYFTLGKLKFFEGKLAEANSHLNQSLDLAVSLNNRRIQGDLHSFIGNIFQQIGDKQKAKENYYKSIEIFASIRLSNYVAEAKVSLASVLVQEGLYDSAFVLIKDLEQTVRKSERKVNFITYLSLMGDIYMYKKITDTAKNYFNKALAVSIETNDVTQVANSYFSLAQVSEKQNNPREALKFLLKALPYAESSHDIAMCRDLYEFLARVYKTLGMYKEAFTILSKFHEIDNSLQLAKQGNKIDSLEQAKKADSTKIENEAIENRLINNLEYKNKIIFLMTILALATIIFFFILYLIKKRSNKALNSKNQELELTNKEKDQYLNIITTDLKRAAEYVLSLIPKPITDRLLTEWIYIPSEQLGGDSFGYHWIDDNNFAIYLIDVSGHGIKASLHTVSVINALRSHGLPNTDMTKPVDVVKCLNDRFQMSAHGDMYFTLWYGVFNNEKRELTYSGCGHPPVMLMDGKSGHEIILLESQNLFVGGVKHPVIKSDTISVELPTTLFVYSDGSYEIKLTNGTYWSDMDFRELLFEYERKNKSLKELYSQIKSMNNQKVLEDDFSILKLKIS